MDPPESTIEQERTMATGDETQAGPRPSLPPRRPPAPEAADPTMAAHQAPHPLDRFGTPPEVDGATTVRSSGGSGGSGGAGAGGGQRRGAGRPQILAHQANEWEENKQEVEVVRTRRTGLILLFLLALLAVAAIALTLAIISVFRDGDDSLTGGAGDTDAGGSTETTEPAPTSSVTIADPNALQFVFIEEPFICDGGTRPFAALSGAAPNEQVDFESPQSPNLSPGTADANGELQVRWQCNPEQAGTSWSLTATGATSGKTVTFLFAGATEATNGTTETTASAPAPTELTVELIENPFSCDGASRIFAGLSGADPNEDVEFSSPQSPNLRSGTADADGNLPVRWSCDPDQAGMTWDLTATGATSGRSVTFSITGS